MLVNFTFKNYRSFRNEKTLSMEAASIRELSDSVVKQAGEALLPVAVMYGANSSGKSNVLKALKAMRDVVLNSVKLNPNDPLDADPFVLDLTSAAEPTSFEIQFVLGSSKFRYGFDYTSEIIIAEWLYEKREKEREFELFLRSEDEFKISRARFAEGVGKEGATPRNRLFLSLVAQLNGKLAKQILDWFSSIEYISGMDGKGYAGKTLRTLYFNADGSREIMNMLGSTHLGFNGIQVRLTPGEEESVDSRTIHNIYDCNGEVVGQKEFSTDKMESEGTKKMIEIAAPIVDAIRSGRLLIVDELDAKLHPFLSRKIVGMFMDKEVNRHGAQLIFATHDTNLLSDRCLRRDQIWFTEKDRTDSTDLYSLVEFRDEAGSKVRNDRNILNDYINGRYGAIPFMS